MAKKVDQQIRALEERVAELENKWKRALADYDNLRKRTEKERQDFIKFSNARLLDKLLPVLDSLEKCQRHQGGEGLRLLLGQFKQVLESEGLREIEALGKKFDPMTMDAMEMSEGEKNKVIGIIMKGYELNGKTLRPIRVKVGTGKKSE